MWTMGQEIQIELPEASTYAQIVENNGNMMIITRTGDYWVYVFSNDDGATWSEPKEFLKQGLTNYAKVYCLTQMTGSKFVKLYDYGQVGDALDSNRISYSAIDLETLIVYDKENGNQIADLNSSAIVTDDTKVLYNVPSGFNLRLLDVSGDAVDEAIFTFCEFSQADSNVGKYHLMSYNLTTDVASVADIADHGGYFTHAYPGGAYIRSGLQGETDASTIVYTSRKDGSEWIIEKWSISGTTSTLVSEMVRSTNILSRPIPPQGTLASTGVEIFYNEATYYLNYTDWKSRIKTITY